MKIVKLSDVIRRANTKVDKDHTDLIYYVGGEHIETENIRVNKRGLIAGSTIGPMFYYGFKAGDFLLVSRNPHLKKAGVVDFDGICSEKTFVLETADASRLLPEFLPFILQNQRFWDYAYQHRHGSTNTFINWSTLANYEFQLPDLETQRKLAAVLWFINDTIEAYKKLISATDELVKSQFIEMFGDSNKYHKKQISDVAEVIAGGDRPKDISEVMTAEYRYPIYANGIENEGLQCYSKEFRVDKTAVTISARGTIGATFIRPPYFTPVVRLITVIPKAELNPVFLKYAIDYAELISNGSSQQQLTIPNVKKIEVVIPPVNKQNNYASFVVQSDKSKSFCSIPSK